MILIWINFHFLCISEYESMLVQAGSFWIPFSLFKTVVYPDILNFTFTFYNNGPNLPIYQIGGDMTFVQIQFEKFFKNHITVYMYW